MRDIAKNIRDLRQKKNITQEMFAEMLYVTRQTVSNYETGRSRPDIDMLIKIAQCLDTDINTVIYGLQPSDRKKRIVKVCVSLAVAAVTTILLSAADAAVLRYRNQTYIVWPWLLSEILVKPLIPAIWGWTIVHCVGSFTSLRPLCHKQSRKLLWVLCGLIAVYFAILIPEVISVCSVCTEMFIPRFLERLAYILMGMDPHIPAFLKYIPFTGIFGVATWFTGIGIRQHET